MRYLHFSCRLLMHDQHVFPLWWAFPLFGRLCATDLQALALLCPPTLSGCVRGTWATGASSPPVRRQWPSLGGARGKSVFAWIVMSTTDCS